VSVRVYASFVSPNVRGDQSGIGNQNHDVLKISDDSCVYDPNQDNEQVIVALRVYGLTTIFEAIQLDMDYVNTPPFVLLLRDFFLNFLS
jgi:hypothetical protein